MRIATLCLTWMLAATLGANAPHPTPQALQAIDQHFGAHMQRLSQRDPKQANAVLAQAKQAAMSLQGQQQQPQQPTQGGQQ